MDRKWSPQQVSDEFVRMCPRQGRMQVSHETSYQALSVPAPGRLRADPCEQLWTGRAMRRPHGSTGAGGALWTDVVWIREGPAEADDRAVPWHCVGDLILDGNCRWGLPDGHSAPAVRSVMIPAMGTLREQLRRWSVSGRGTCPAPRHHPGERAPAAVPPEEHRPVRAPPGRR